MRFGSAVVVTLVVSLALGACQSSNDDTAGAGGEADTDTDADSDADSDADTDVGWHADTLAFDLTFGWDATKTQVTTASLTGEPLRNAAWVMLFNSADMDKSKTSTEFCALSYDLDGAAATDARFASYWVGFDLSGLVPEVGADTDRGPGDCDGLGSFIDVTRGIDQPVDEFVAALGFGLGVGSYELVDYESAKDWQAYWEKHDLASDYGEWDDLEPYFALAGFTSAVKTLGAVDAPKPFGVSYAYELNKGEVTMKGDQGVVLSLSEASSAPTAYFRTQALYIYGTGF
jgi:hypothetical protein